MKSPQSPRLAAFLAPLFENPSPTYALVAMLVLVAGLTVVFVGELRPGLLTHGVMLVTMLFSSRLFNSNTLRKFWYVTVGLIAVVLLFDVAAIVAA